jgi:hypothetical protein
VCKSLRGSADACNGDATSSGWLPDHVYRSSSIAATAYTVVSHAGLSDHDLLVTEMNIPAP